MRPNAETRRVNDETLSSCIIYFLASGRTVARAADTMMVVVIMISMASASKCK
jgi:hypothetical protein